MNTRRWLFVFAACSGIGGLASFLYWLGIKPKDLLGWHISLAIPHWLWLTLGLLLFAFSIGLSVYSLCQTRLSGVTKTPVSVSDPTIGLTLRSASMDPYEHSPGRWYPRQLALFFSNDGDEIHLGMGTWIKGQIGIQAGRPPRFVYFRKNPLGKWDGEATDKIVYPGNWVKISVGLDSTVSDNDLKKLADNIRLGTVEISSVVSGTAVKIRTEILVSREVFSRFP
jgi:hypothetical protein